MYCFNSILKSLIIRRATHESVKIINNSIHFIKNNVSKHPIPSSRQFISLKVFILPRVAELFIHKEKQRDIIIHKNSCRPLSHKHAAFHSMINRLISIPLKETAYSQELEIIKEIAVKMDTKRNS